MPILLVFPHTVICNIEEIAQLSDCRINLSEIMHEIIKMCGGAGLKHTSMKVIVISVRKTNLKGTLGES